MATAVPVPVADGLFRENRHLGDGGSSLTPALLVLLSHSPVHPPCWWFRETLLCSLMVNYLSFRRKNRLPYSKNLQTPNKHWPLPTRTKKDCSRRLGNTTLSLSSDSRWHLGYGEKRSPATVPPRTGAEEPAGLGVHSSFLVCFLLAASLGGGPGRAWLHPGAGWLCPWPCTASCHYVAPSSAHLRDLLHVHHTAAHLLVSWQQCWLPSWPV